MLFRSQNPDLCSEIEQKLRRLLNPLREAKSEAKDAAKAVDAKEASKPADPKEAARPGAKETAPRDDKPRDLPPSRPRGQTPAPRA